MAQRINCLGDSGSRGGRVVSATAGIVHNQRPVARKGDLFACAVHGGRHRILGGDTRIAANDQQLARHGDPIACGCTLRSIDPNAGVVLVAKGRSFRPDNDNYCFQWGPAFVAWASDHGACKYRQSGVVPQARPGKLYDMVKYTNTCQNKNVGEAEEPEQKLFDEAVICLIVCCCDEHPKQGAILKPRTNSPNSSLGEAPPRRMQLRGQCLSDVFKSADDLLDGGSRYKPEVSYDMHAPGGPMPNDARRRLPAGQGRRPDIVIAKNPYARLTPDNIALIVEVTYNTDSDSTEQLAAYEEIPQIPGLVVNLNEDGCQCDDLRRRRRERFLEISAMLAAMILARGRGKPRTEQATPDPRYRTPPAPGKKPDDPANDNFPRPVEIPIPGSGGNDNLPPSPDRFSPQRPLKIP